jgi:hypothetical protein
MRLLFLSKQLTVDIRPELPMTLLRAAPSSCDAQFTAVLCKLRSWGG